MTFTSKNVSLLILLVTSIIGSRIFFLSINDPEGPNLLVSAVAVAFIFFISVFVYKFNRLTAEFPKLLLTVFVQAALVLGLIYFLS